MKKKGSQATHSSYFGLSHLTPPPGLSLMFTSFHEIFRVYAGQAKLGPDQILLPYDQNCGFDGGSKLKQYMTCQTHNWSRNVDFIDV